MRGMLLRSPGAARLPSAPAQQLPSPFIHPWCYCQFYPGQLFCFFYGGGLIAPFRFNMIADSCSVGLLSQAYYSTMRLLSRTNYTAVKTCPGLLSLFLLGHHCYPFFCSLAAWDCCPPTCCKAMTEPPPWDCQTFCSP